MKRLLVGFAAAVITVVALGTLLFVWDPWGASRTATSPASSAAPISPVALPSEPPSNSGCQGNVVGHSDLKHPALGTVRVFLLRDASAGTGCVLPVTESGRVLPAIPIDDRGKLGFANPAVDATGNVFITYNPGRYDGVLVLIPDAQGFEDIGWAPDMSGTHYIGKHAYYYAELLAPNDKGEYAIHQSQNDCEPRLRRRHHHDVGFALEWQRLRPLSHTPLFRVDRGVCRRGAPSCHGVSRPSRSVRTPCNG